MSAGASDGVGALSAEEAGLLAEALRRANLRATTLRQSILKLAFDGVPTDRDAR